MLTKTKYTILSVSGILMYFSSVPASFAQSEFGNFHTNCSIYGDGYINLPNSDLCLKIGGEVR